MKIRFLIMAATLACASVAQAMEKPEDTLPFPEEAVIDFNFVITNNTNTNILICQKIKKSGSIYELYPKLFAKQWPFSIWQQGLLDNNEFRKLCTPLRFIAPSSEPATIQHKLKFHKDRLNTGTHYDRFDTKSLYFLPVNEKSQLIHNYFWHLYLCIFRDLRRKTPTIRSDMAYIENNYHAADVNHEYNIDSIPTSCTMQFSLIDSLDDVLAREFYRGRLSSKMLFIIHDTQKEAQKRATKRIADAEEHKKKNSERLLNFITTNKTNPAISDPAILQQVRHESKAARILNAQRNIIEYIFPLVKDNPKVKEILSHSKK
jgi:hypothetical protein